MLVRRDGSPWRTCLIVGAVVAVVLLLVCIVGVIAYSLVSTPDIFEDEGDEPPSSATASDPLGVATIAVLDVDQGQAVAIISPDGSTALVDSGRSQARFELEVAPYLRSLGVSSIDYLILSHPDQDHVGAMPRVFELFPVGTWVDPAIPTTNQTYGETLEIVLDEDIPALLARQGEELMLDGGVTIDLLWPQDELMTTGDEPDSNENSVVVRVTYQDVSVLIPGDLETDGEAALIDQLGTGLDADVLVAGHHGSNSSSSGDFLDAVDPDVAIISAGENNPYGHPHDEVLQRLRFRGIEIYRTDLDGTINIAISDGDYTIDTVETDTGV